MLQTSTCVKLFHSKKKLNNTTVIKIARVSQRDTSHVQVGKKKTTDKNTYT